MILERHGVENARKALGKGETQDVTVIDAADEVRLSIGGYSFPAGLTPDQARLIAKHLVASAKRVEDRRAAEPSKVQP